MDTSTLASQAINVLVRLFAGNLKGPAATAATGLYDLIFRNFTSTGDTGILEQLKNSPRQLPRQDAVSGVLSSKLDSNERFRNSVSSMVENFNDSLNDQSQNAAHVTADRGSIAAGRDLSVDQSKRTDKTNYGGIVVALFAVVVVLILVAAWPKIQSALQNVTTGGGMSANTTCRDFLAADSNSQAQIMKKVYLDANKPSLASDPFIVQNAEYFCGQAPNMTLGHLAESRRGN